MKDGLASRGTLLTVLFGLFGAFVMGCGLPREVALAEGFSDRRTPYGEALALHTRHVELYQGLDTVAKGWATWKSAKLRSSLAEASIRAYGLQGDAADSLRREEERASRLVWEFHLALYTPKKNWNDLESADTLWRFHLELPGGRTLDPVQVVAVSKSDKSPVQYPYVTLWTREYSVFFPKLEGGEEPHPRLILRGPLGKIAFAF